MLRVRFAPSPTGFLHVGSARTFIFNWLYARHNRGTMILRVDDTDVERNTEASLTSIFEGLNWLNLPWDEQYRQSERLDLHRQMAEAIFARGLAYRDFTPAHAGDGPKSEVALPLSRPGEPAPSAVEGAGQGGDFPNSRATGGGAWLFNPGAREISREQSDQRAAAGEPFALRFRVPREPERIIRFNDAVYGEQAKSTADIEDFALLRSDGMPTYHMASCADDADLRISHIIRGQDHLTNTFKHILIFEALGIALPQFAHLPLLVAPDGTKLSKRKHGPVVSVTTYRDAGFLPEAFVNFLCLLGWSPKQDREFLTRQELIDLFSLEGINRANAVINFKDVVAPPLNVGGPPLSRPGLAGQGGGVPLQLREGHGSPPGQSVGITVEGHGFSRAENGVPFSSSPEGAKPVPIEVEGAPEGRKQTYPEETFDPKALWLNAEHIRALPLEDLSQRLLTVVQTAGIQVDICQMQRITPLVRERIKLLRDVLTVADFFFVDQLPPYDPSELIPQKGDREMALKALKKAREVLANIADTDFKHDTLDAALRAAAQELKLKAGQMFQPIRVAVCGRKNAPPLFETLEVLGKEKTLARIEQAISKFA
jgi:glutamyl/glutaminyl-tRNA synthetase